MIKIGIVGLDTSHAESYAMAIRNHPETSLAAVWDGGAVRDRAYARAYGERNGATLYDEPLEMADDVDAVMILTLDWTTHRDLAVPFLRDAVPTAIDKPVVGSLEDVRAIRSAANETPLFGGSAVPYHPSLRSIQVAGDGWLFYGVGYGDPFYYGCHVVDAIRFLVDHRWASVAPADGPGRSVDVVFVDGSHATIHLDGASNRVGASNRETFTFVGVGDETVIQEVETTHVDLEAMYRGYLDAFVEAITGARDAAGERMLDAATLLLGANAALEEGRTITPTSDSLAAYDVDGRAFLDDYQPYY
ncbi:Gfo/Idh/MocA family protein [Natronosalvus halobius]|uniref:Gfo/Idh/MocA family protein n=1 Tax=Natronosalvus halobius TaxID=2953746 RepID=UPI0020A1AE93|nr:Gfo/Idh/MocA family oxidoreductase [Natronosalvus halobius]USZ72401.1 Gfo/Idh/MocA family oxidoreductase [Natronosalvus halobius]